MAFYADIKDEFKIETTILKIYGIYPSQNENNFQTFVRVFRSLTLLHPACFMLLAALGLRLVVQQNEITVISDIFYMLITIICYWNKVIWFIYNNHKLLAIEDLLDASLMYKNMQVGDDKYMKDALKLLFKITLFFRVNIVGVMVFYAVLPILDGRTLPFFTWYPIDMNRYHYFIYVQQIVSLVWVAITNSTMDILCCAHMTIASGYFWILKTKLRRIDYAGKNADADLKDCVDLHKHLIVLAKLIEDMFSRGIFVQFFCSVIVICVTCFQMLVVAPQNAEFLLFYLICILCQVSMYCWYGNEIINESDGIGDACYNSNWYEGTRNQKKSLFMIMERSKRQISLTAGKLFTLSLPTLVLIFKSSYSYFAVLRRLYQEN